MKLIHKTPVFAAGVFLLSLLTMDSIYAQQNAEDYFHSGANSFINNDLPTAINEVNTGLSKYPNDPKLNALLEKLKEEQQKQQQQQNQQQDQQQQNQDQNQQQQDQNQQDQEQENEQQQEQNDQRVDHVPNGSREVLQASFKALDLERFKNRRRVALL